ncbi:hypothetical protein R1sor_003688 [Riccia sorocarpa]|uniref:Reverse transcriptase domain-containing protein n=1 Tax=Riccia sorocarpa TaxID=122646 RepID=A0ABD3H4G9_9MARC
MTTIEIDSGQLVEDQEDILEEEQKYYQKLYSADEETTEMLESRRVVVGRIDRRISTEDNVTLEEVPSEELITSIVMEMPKEKLPGIDGVMIVAKIIAIRLKEKLPRIIDTQQTGFVAGRNIIDNIMSLRLGQE